MQKLHPPANCPPLLGLLSTFSSLDGGQLVVFFSIESVPIGTFCA